MSCIQLVRTWGSGVTLKSRPAWMEAQACSKSSTSSGPRKLEVWTVPSSVPIDFNGEFTVYTLDAQTRVPVKASLSVGNEILYSKAAPDGKLTSWYWFPWKTKLVRMNTRWSTTARSDSAEFLAEAAGSKRWVSRIVLFGSRWDGLAIISHNSPICGQIAKCAMAFP